MPQPRPGVQCSHQRPAGFSIASIWKTLQHKVQVPQALPGTTALFNKAEFEDMAIDTRKQRRNRHLFD